MATAVTSSDRLVLADLVPGGLVRDAALIAAGAGLTGQKAVDLGVTPFLLTDALKLAIAALVLPGAWTLVRRMR